MSVTIFCRPLRGLDAFLPDMSLGLAPQALCCRPLRGLPRERLHKSTVGEGPETLALTLSHLTGGAVFGVPSTATLTIADDVTEPATNPIDAAENFVRQHYSDFLNREPDASGLAFWRNQITDQAEPV